MAKVDINIIKEWFRNLKKPNQEQFWSWLDSFRHKDEAIPMSDVSNLTTTLTKKADLVNGVVPENQLPFTINANEVISIGEITTTTNSVTVGVHSSGSNKVRINGQILTRNFSNTLPFTPVTTGNKFLRIVARAETGLFFLREGSESEEPQEPALQSGDVHVRLILVTPTGSEIDPEVLSGFVEKEEESWKVIDTRSSTDFVINYSDKRTRFKIQGTFDTPKVLQSIIFEQETERAVEFWVYNNTGKDININNVATSGLAKGFQVYGGAFKIIANGKALLKYNPATDIIECWKDNSIGGGGGISTVTTDATLQGKGSEAEPLGLSEDIKDEIAGKISKQGINLGDSGNIPEMKTGAISGIYRGNPASNPVYDFSPFFQMSTGDTFAQLHFNYLNGEMAYRAGNVDEGYSPIRISWDTGNLVNPATQGWVSERYVNKYENAVGVGFTNGNFNEAPYIFHSSGNYAFLATSTWVNQQVSTKQDKSMFSALVDKWIHFYDSATAKMQPIIKLVTGAINQLEFDGRMKLAALILPANTNANVANRLWSDGTYVYYDDSLARPSRLAYKDEMILLFHQPIKTVYSSITLNDTYYNSIVRVVNNATITVPSNLRSDFKCVFESIETAIVIFQEGSGVSFSAPFGKILRDNAMCTFYKISDNYYRINGTLV